MAVTGMMTLSIVFRIPTIISLNRWTPINKSSLFQSRQSDQQIQGQKLRLRNLQRVIGLNRQVVKQPSLISRKLRQNSSIITSGLQFHRNTVLPRNDMNRGQKKANIRKNGQMLVSAPFVLTDKFQPVILGNKSRQLQFVRLRKLLQETSFERIKKTSDEDREKFQLHWFNFRHGPFNLTNRFSIPTKINRTNLITAAPSLLSNGNNFDLESKNFKSFTDNEFHLEFHKTVTLPTNDTSSTLIKLPNKEQSQQHSEHVAFQNKKQNLTVTQSISLQEVQLEKAHRSSPFTLQPPSPTKVMFDSNLSNSSLSNAGPPGFAPPNDEIIAQLNGAQNFHDLAKLMKLQQNFSRNSMNDSN
ncbi:hypothetical protein ACH3XW_11545 [Acanthocheilonema viteae]